MSKDITNLFKIIAIFALFQYCTIVFGQCQGSLTNDAGPSNYREGQVPTNIITDENSLETSLAIKIKEQNLKWTKSWYAGITIMLMFVAFFSRKNKFFRLSLAAYVAPFILFYPFQLINESSGNDSFLLIFGLITFIWGTHFNFILRYSRSDNHVSVTLFKIILFLVWIVMFVWAKTLGAYMITAFFMGSIFREKEIVPDMLSFINCYKFFFLFLYIQTFLLIGHDLSRLREYRSDIMFFVLGTFLIGLFYLVGLPLIMRKVTKKDYNQPGLYYLGSLVFLVLVAMA